jgi:hypothetical protein
MRAMRAIALTLMISMCAMTTTGCIGRMALSGKVMQFNLSVTENKWGRELTFLVLYIIPVYPISGAIDLIIINSIEFWTGTNPLNGEARLAFAGDQKHVVAPDGTEAISTLREDGSIDIEVRAADGTSHFVNVVRDEGRVVARDADGRNLAAVDSTTGEIKPLADAESL